MAKGGKTAVFQAYKNVLPLAQQDLFDAAPDLTAPDWCEAFSSFLFAQYVSVCGQMDLCNDAKLYKVLAGRAESLVSQIRMVKQLHATQLPDTKRPPNIKVAPYRKVEGMPDRKPLTKPKTPPTDPEPPIQNA